MAQNFLNMKFNWKQPLLKMAINLLTGYIEKKVKDADIKGYLSRRMDEVQAGFTIIIDKNPQDKEQFKELFEQRKAFFVDDNILTLADQLNERIKDEFAKNIVVTVLMQYANQDGTPITDDLKAAYPDLPWDAIGGVQLTKFGKGSKAKSRVSRVVQLRAEGITLENVFTEGEAKEATPKTATAPKTKAAPAAKSAPKTAAKNAGDGKEEKS